MWLCDFPRSGNAPEDVAGLSKICYRLNRSPNHHLLALWKATMPYEAWKISRVLCFQGLWKAKKSYSTCDSKTSTILLAWSIFSAMIFNNLIGLGALKWSQKRSQPPPAHPFRETLGRARCAPRLFLGTRGDPPSCASWGGQDLCFKRLNPVP